MSAKWVRSKAWDDANIPASLWPVKWVLRALSSISLAIVLLVLVVVYIILASVPIGMLAQLPTWIIYGMLAVALLGVVAIVPAWLFWRVTRAKGQGLRFTGVTLLILALSPVAGWLWLTFAWPKLHYDPVSGKGLMLLAEFCSQYRSTTLRRMPGIEMTELQFYAWWPLRIILLTFVLNMVVATVRRIEFSVPNIGVLTVHTGIVTITLGSMYYGALKKEGDTLLVSGQPGQDGVPTVGPPQEIFYDSTALSLYVGQQLGYEERPVEDIPRYNDYNVGAFAGDSALETARRAMPWKNHEDPHALTRPLDLAVPPGAMGIVDQDISFRVVGFTSYAEPVQDWRRVDVSTMTSVSASFQPSPLRVLYLISDLPDDKGVVSDKPAFSFILLPGVPAERISALAGMLAVEYTIQMSDQRWNDLGTKLSPGIQHGIVVEIPAAEGREAIRTVINADPRDLPIKTSVGGYDIEIRELLEQPPFPIITQGFKGATSSVAVVRVTRPGEAGFKPFNRYVYHRFPEINQEMLDEVNERGMPVRRDPDPSIRIAYIDASKIQIYVDEHAGADGVRKTRALVRAPGSEPRTIDSLPPDGMIDQFVSKLSLRLGPAWEHAEPVERPSPVATNQQDRSLIGTHDKSMLGVEVTASLIKDKMGSPWKTVVWLPFTKYMGVGMGTERDIFLPDGRMVRLAFGRRQHPLPGFRVRLIDFQMIAYDHRGAPRDYQSLLRVEPTHGTFTGYDHVTKLNAPLTAPFHWSDERSSVANAFGRVVSGLDPNQFKFSQAGWDQTGWARTQQETDAGRAKRPWASFTILGVGNNPGIHVIALGSVMMGVGIPWAFYLKPYLMQRRKQRIKAMVEAGTYVKPGTDRAAGQPAAAARSVETVP